MDSNLLIAIVGFIFTLVGFLLRSFVDFSLFEKQEKKRIAIKGHADRLSQQLSNFYWPLYFRLQKDNAVYRLMFERNDENKKDVIFTEDFRKDIETNFILPNHDEIIKIIESNIHLAELDIEFEEQILKYVRHIAVYKALRASGNDDANPDDYGGEWPSKLFKLLDERTHKLQNEYEKLVIDDRK